MTTTSTTAAAPSSTDPGVAPLADVSARPHRGGRGRRPHGARVAARDRDAVRRRARGPGAPVRRCDAGRARPRHQRRRGRPTSSGACSTSSSPPTAGSCTSLQRGSPTATPGSTSYAMSGDTVDTGSRRELLAVEQPYANHNGGEHRVRARRLPVRGARRRGQRRRPRGQRTGHRGAARQDPAHRPRRPRRGDEYGIPRRQPVRRRARRARPRCGCTASATPGASRSTPRPATCGSADVGQNSYEEIDLLPAADGGGRGANLGWNEMEATHPFEGGSNPDGAVLPVFEYDRSEGGCSVTGGVVYRGAAIPALDGAYLFTDYCDGRIRAVRAADGQAVDQSAPSTRRPATWCRSATTPPARSTSCRSTARSTGSTRCAWLTADCADVASRTADDPAHRHAGRVGGGPADRRGRAAQPGTEGFVHCSTRAQLAGTLDRHFAGAGPLVLLVLDLTATIARTCDGRRACPAQRRSPTSTRPSRSTSVMAVEQITRPQGEASQPSSSRGRPTAPGRRRRRPRPLGRPALAARRATDRPPGASADEPRPAPPPTSSGSSMLATTRSKGPAATGVGAAGRVALDHRQPVGHAVAVGVGTRGGHGGGIDVDADGRAGPSAERRDRQHAAAAPEVEHPLAAAHQVVERRERQARRGVGAAGRRPGRVDHDPPAAAGAGVRAGGGTHGGCTTSRRPTTTGRACVAPGVERAVEVDRPPPRPATGRSPPPAAAPGRRRPVAGDEHDPRSARRRSSIAGGPGLPQCVGRQLGLGRGNGRPHDVAHGRSAPPPSGSRRAASRRRPSQREQVVARRVGPRADDGQAGAAADRRPPVRA